MAILDIYMDILDLYLYMDRKFAPKLFATHISEARYYCPTIRFDNPALQIICVGREICQPDYLNDRLSFPWWGIELVVKGEGELVISGKQYHLSPGTLFCYNPHIPHKIAANQNNSLIKYFINFSGSKAAPMMTRGPLQAGKVVQALYPQELQQILDRILIEGNRKSKHAAEIVVQYMHIFLHKLHESSKGIAGKKTSRSFNSYLQAQELIDSSYAQFTTIEEIAKKLHLTSETMSRLFRRFSTQTPYQYLLNLKMNRAADLLLGTNLLIKEIAEQVGFHDALHFSRLFRKTRGNSPESFRRTRKRHDSRLAN